MEESKEVFKRKLMEFFERHDPDKVFLVPKIADKFEGQEDEVYKHLTELYAEKEGHHISDESLLSLIPPSQEGSEY